MKSVIIYNSFRGTTRILVKKFQSAFKFDSDLMNLNDFCEYKLLDNYQLYIFFTPTYGDGELHQVMEDFIERLSINLQNKYFIICESGNYIGYDEFNFGSMKIIKNELISKKAIEFAEGLSLDSSPRINWDHFYDWEKYLNKRSEEYV